MGVLRFQMVKNSFIVPYLMNVLIKRLQINGTSLERNTILLRLCVNKRFQRNGTIFERHKILPRLCVNNLMRLAAS